MKVGFGFRMRLTIEQIVENKIRLLLTVLGMGVSLFIFLSAYFFIDSFYGSKFQSIRFYDENDLYVFEFADASNEVSGIGLMEELCGNEYLKLRREIVPALDYEAQGEGKNYMVVLNVFDVNNNFDASLIMTNNDIKTSKLLEGRTISEDDIKNGNQVIVLGSNYAHLIFGENVLGREIQLPCEFFTEDSSGVLKRQQKMKTYTIIGVYDDSAIEAVAAAEDKVCGDGYIPVTAAVNESTAREVTFVYSGKSPSEEEVTRIRMQCGTYMKYRDYRTLAAEIEEANQSLRYAVNIVVYILLVISAIMIGQNLLFSMKERIPEFGIKRAIGAKPSHIALDIILEVLVYAVISFVSALIMSVLFVLIVLNVLKNNGTFPDISFIMKGKSLLTGGAILLWMSTTAVVFPLAYVGKKNIVDTIRFE